MEAKEALDAATAYCEYQTFILSWMLKMEPITYRGLQNAADQNTPHLGGSIKAGDPFTYCPLVWDYVISRFCIQSVLDLGSGCGNAAHYFHKAGLRVLATDGFPESVEKSTYPAFQQDITQAPIVTRTDLVHCQEVVEHIDERYLENVLLSLTCGKYILMTHAVPGQIGYHHVNLQTSEYWIDHLHRKGCEYLEADTRRIRNLAEKDGAAYMQQSGLSSSILAGFDNITAPASNMELCGSTEDA
ncbi:class I SAM-dependent methyltransferase [Bradyrhizobium sp. 27S5]|uniref:class I SAM-dependent methyltransferase n=1 Tax=Bradyrhizobium sp. 27S5 TaxID=3139728 RepID=UPI0030CBEBB4